MQRSFLLACIYSKPQHGIRMGSHFADVGVRAQPGWCLFDYDPFHIFPMAPQFVSFALLWYCASYALHVMQARRARNARHGSHDWHNTARRDGLEAVRPQ